MRRSLNALALIFAVLIVFLFWAKAPVSLDSPFVDNAVVPYPGVTVKKYGGTLRVVSYNMGYAYGDANNDHIISEDAVLQNLEAAAKAFEELAPDVIGFQEIDFDSHRTGRIDQLDWLAKRLKFSYAAYAVNWNKTYVPFPYWPPQNHFGRMVSGQAVLSRFPITKNRIHTFDKPPNPFWYNWFYLDRLAQEVTLDLDGRSVILWNLHLEAFHQPTRIAQAKELSQLVKASENELKIVVGDLNDPHTAGIAGGLSEDALGVFLDKTGFSEAVSEAHAPTFPSWAPVDRLDHIVFAKPIVASASGETHTAASDHLPVWADLIF